MNSKKILLLILFIIIITFVNANPVGEEKVNTVVKNFLTKNNQKKSINTITLLSDNTGNDYTTLIYVINLSPEGFILIAADDNVAPILAYSFEDNFMVENMPSNIAYFIGTYKDQIKLSIENQLKPNEEIINKWNELLSEGNITLNLSKAALAPLVLTKWNQYSPYNLLCPGGSVTGCVATAMAQIMKYWNFPEQGVGSHSYSHTQYGELSANFENTFYQWNLMTNTYGYSSSAESNMAVATLMYHCGVSVNMNYSPSGSGGSTDLATIRLKENFNYKDQIVAKYRNNFSNSEWTQLLKDELNLGRPIFYAGWNEESGHAFICDGYDSQNYFHYNWGWGGSCDGYYQNDHLSPGSGGAGSGAGTYNLDQYAHLGIEPKNLVNISGGSSTNYQLILYNFLEISGTEILQGQNFYISTNIANIGQLDFNGQVSVIVKKLPSYEVVDTFNIYNTLIGHNQFVSNEGYIFNSDNSQLEQGDYIAYVVYKANGTNNWINVPNYQSLTNGLTFTVFESNVCYPELSMPITTNLGNIVFYQENLLMSYNIKIRGVVPYEGKFGLFFRDFSNNILPVDSISTILPLPVGYSYTNGINFSEDALLIPPGNYYLEAKYKKKNTNEWILIDKANYTNPKIIQVVSLTNSQNIEKNNVVIFPNPAKNELNIDLSNYSKVETIKIFNNLGRVVYEIDNPSNVLFINLSDFSNGMYLIEAIANNQIFSGKFEIIK